MKTLWAGAQLIRHFSDDESEKQWRKAEYSTALDTPATPRCADATTNGIRATYDNDWTPIYLWPIAV